MSDDRGSSTGTAEKKKNVLKSLLFPISLKK